MEQFTDFLDIYFDYIWLISTLILVYFFFIRGKKSIQLFSNLDMNKLIYSERNASGYSTKSIITKLGGARKVLHIIISDKELIIKTYLFLAYIADMYDLLHRIPLENIKSMEIKKNSLFSKLFVKFKNQNGELKEIVLISKNNELIKEILEKKKYQLSALP